MIHAALANLVTRLIDEAHERDDACDAAGYRAGMELAGRVEDARIALDQAGRYGLVHD